MKVLVITLNAWDDTGSTGNTISNIFAGQCDVEVANIFCRNERVNNQICNRYFKITEGQILRGLFTRENCGETFLIEGAIEKAEETYKGYNPLANNSVGNALRRFRPPFLLFIREFIWMLPSWKNENLKTFLSSFKPDVIYMHGHSNWYMHRLMEYCAQITQAKIVMFYGDDMYGRKRKLPLGYLYETIYRKRVRRSIKMADLLFGGSEKLCVEYGVLFGKKFTPLYKQCDLSHVVKKKEINHPLQLVYAGNLLFGREEMLRILAQTIKNVNENNPKNTIQLIVYSNTKPSSRTLSYINDGYNSIFMGTKPYQEVCAAMNEADLTLFVESFKKDNTKKTRLSFSTKIIDCMQSSSAMLAIGPEYIASMDYIINSHMAFVATSITEIYPMLFDICNHDEMIPEKCRIKYEFARLHHQNTSETHIIHIKSII